MDIVKLQLEPAAAPRGTDHSRMKTAARWIFRCFVRCQSNASVFAKEANQHEVRFMDHTVVDGLDRRTNKFTLSPWATCAIYGPSASRYADILSSIQYPSRRMNTADVC
jgi:hypothetical protein